MWKFLTGSAIAFSLVGTPALADWNTVDTNDDEFVDFSEFDEELGEQDVFKTWDTDGDGVLSQGEFSTGLYGHYDQDEDKLWSEEEFGEWDADDWM